MRHGLSEECLRLLRKGESASRAYSTPITTSSSFKSLSKYTPSLESLLPISGRTHALPHHSDRQPTSQTPSVNTQSARNAPNMQYTHSNSSKGTLFTLRNNGFHGYEHLGLAMEDIRGPRDEAAGDHMMNIIGALAGSLLTYLNKLLKNDSKLRKNLQNMVNGGNCVTSFNWNHVICTLWDLLLETASSCTWPLKHPFVYQGIIIGISSLIFLKVVAIKFFIGHQVASILDEKRCHGILKNAV
ncbi:unnamed protein product [Lepeophtheirus salmonis]|uniref:(salmon louse) hypothetical protein n=1 Tax=Lepeophtheirus salmonis TaxID=72036 RepID=A0A7R8H7F4_LEPSM|nr:unnamed protein product [Lepeophtheirus salmonis]CAF2900681.1 unnamed protein product [Lepeophtheirus salmonis]